MLVPLRLLWFALLCLACLPFATRAQEPITGDYFAHDPSTMIKEGNRYYVFTTGFALPYKYSTNRVNWVWNSSQRVFPNGPPAWVTNAEPGFDENYWAPDVAYFNGKYHVYYSASKWGTIDSVIGLMTTPSLISPVWTDQGKVIQSDASCCTQPETDLTANNCIDPAILVRTNGDVWMVFGSYSDGILVMQLDPATGKRLNTNTAPTKVASSSAAFFSNTTEGAYLHERNGFFYLFINYGGCCSGIESTYNIRVGRSTSVTGPYLDKNGVNMLPGGGSMVLESTGKYVGPGHAAILVEGATNWFTYHYYDANNNGTATLGLNRLYWDTNNWPVLTNDWSAFYPFDVDARDHRGIYSGTLFNGATTTNDPAHGRVLGLDGATNFATLKFPVANASTFATWVKWNGGADWQRIFDFGSNTVRYFFLTPRASSGKMRFAIRNGGSEQFVDAPTALPTNSWCHVAVTLDGARGTLFLNGAPVATNNSMTIRPWQVQARTNLIGDSTFASDPLFSGLVDSFRVFGRPLNAAEVRDLAWAHPALAHRYSFNANAADSIGMAHGTLFGNATITNNALKLTGTSGGYVGLPGGLVSQCSAVSFEFWATFGVNANWTRVFDFGNSSGGNGSQYVFFSPHTPSGSQRFEISTSAGTFSRDPTPTLDNRTVHVVCILDRTNNYAAIYTNGVLELSVTTNLPPLTAVGSNFGYIGRSLFSADGWLNATIDEFRIYDGRLTPEQIADNYLAGPAALYPLNVVWSGGINGIWDISTTGNWQRSSLPFTYLEGDVVRLDDTASGPTTVNLAVNVSPASITVSNVAKSYALTGSAIAGPTSLTKSGTGILTLNNANTYSGGTTIKGGTLLVNNPGGSGTGSGVVTVGSAGTLGGTGTLDGAVTVQSGGTLAPGTSIGTLTLNDNLTLGGSLAVEVNTSTSPSNDFCVVNGTLTNAATGWLTVANLGPALSIGDSFTLFNQPLSNGGALTITPAPGVGLTWTNKLAIDGTIAVVASGPTSYIERIYAVTTDNQLISFQNNAPGTILSSMFIGGLQGSEQIVGVDFVGDTLYAVGNSSRLYILNRVSALATLVGQFTPAISGSWAGVEVEPPGVRVLTDLDQQLVLNLGNGVATVGTTLVGSPNPTITGLAYHPGTGVRYVADYVQNTIGTLDPSTGLVTPIGATTIDFSRNHGFDISSRSAYTAYLATPASSSGLAANLYTVDLGTGTASLVGLIGNAGDNLLMRGLAVGPEFSAAPAANLTPTNITFNVSGGNLTLSWPASHLGWTLQTNAVGLNEPNAWFAYPDSSSLTNVVIMIGPYETNVFFRLAYP